MGSARDQLGNARTPDLCYRAAARREGRSEPEPCHEVGKWLRGLRRRTRVALLLPDGVGCSVAALLQGASALQSRRFGGVGEDTEERCCQKKEGSSGAPARVAVLSGASCGRGWRGGRTKCAQRECGRHGRSRSLRAHHSSHDFSPRRAALGSGGQRRGGRQAAGWRWERQLRQSQMSKLGHVVWRAAALLWRLGPAVGGVGDQSSLAESGCQRRSSRWRPCVAHEDCEVRCALLLHALARRWRLRLGGCRRRCGPFLHRRGVVLRARARRWRRAHAR